MMIIQRQSIYSYLDTLYNQFSLPSQFDHYMCQVGIIMGKQNLLDSKHQLDMKCRKSDPNRDCRNLLDKVLSSIHHNQSNRKLFLVDRESIWLILRGNNMLFSMFCIKFQILLL